MKHPDDPLGKRLKSLEDKLESKNRDRAISEERPNRQRDSAGFAYAMRLSSEFIVAILVGAGIGWAIDRLLGTNPWAMIILLFLGFCAGVLNVMRSAGVVAENSALSRGRKQIEDKDNAGD